MEPEKIVETIYREFKGKAYDYIQGQCMYRTYDGKKCAVGVFIPDGVYLQFPRSGIYGLLSQTSLWEYMPLNKRDNLSELQKFHDRNEYLQSYGKTLEEQKGLLANMALLLHHFEESEAC